GRGGQEKAGGKMTSAAIETPIPATAEPELGEWRCPNGHNSAIRPRLPEVMFHACGHYHPRSLRGMSSVSLVVFGTNRSVSTGTHIAWIASCTPPSTTADTAERRWSLRGRL